MAYPPPLPPTTRTDSTISAGNHAQDHNKLAAALRDVTEVLGADPSGGYASLSERLLAVVAGADQAQAAAASAAAVAVAGFTAPTFSALATVTDVPVGVLADGALYGRNGTNLVRSTNKGASWTTIRDLGADGGLIITILDTSGGEVLIVREQAIYRTTGWASNKATAVLTNVLSAPGSTSFYQWGIDTNPATGVCTAATYIGSTPYNDARYFWVSTNGGATWTVKYDINDHLAGVGGTLANSHTHLAKIDPWADDRLWISWHRSGVAGMGSLLYSDDLGDTWTKLVTAQPTAAVAVKGGMVFSTDENPNGVYVVPRTPDPADMEYQFAYRWDADTLNVAGFGQWAARSPDGERAYVAFIGDVGFKPILVQSDGRAASLMHESPDAIATSLGDGWRSIHYVDDTLIAVDRRDTTYKTMTARRTVARLAEVSPTFDLGKTLGATAHRQRSVASGTGATATAARSVALGSSAVASSTDTVAVGDASAASASEATAVGAGATAGQRCVSVGSDATAAGPDATAVGEGATTGATSLSVAVGSTASTVGSRGTALGYGAIAGADSTVVGASNTVGAALASSVLVGAQAFAEYDLSVGVGHAARSNRYGVALGQAAVIGVAGTIVDKAVALGYLATVAVGHARSVALGSTTTTTAADQVQIGGRHIELTELATDPAAPATDGARLFTKDNGAGKTQVCVRFATGAVQVIATQP